MSNAESCVIQSPCFKLKGSAYTLTTLLLLDTDLSQLEHQLKETVSKAPKFFDQTPVVIDCQAIADNKEAIDMAFLLQQLRDANMIPIGMRGGKQVQQALALSQGLALFPETKKTPQSPTANNHEPKVMASKIIKRPIRSGQQIYAQGGDLVVLSSVSAGAEVLADGHIHVYGALRGRALAGVLGDTSAHIICQNLEAELVSIAGHYRVSEYLKDILWKQAASICLDNEHLHISAL